MIPENKNEDIVKVNYPITKMQINTGITKFKLNLRPSVLICHSKNYNACINSLNNRQDYSTRV